jgi:hypothetical protein
MEGKNRRKDSRIADEARLKNPAAANSHRCFRTFLELILQTRLERATQGSAPPFPNLHAFHQSIHRPSHLLPPTSSPTSNFQLTMWHSPVDNVPLSYSVPDSPCRPASLPQLRRIDDLTPCSRSELPRSNAPCSRSER